MKAAKRLNRDAHIYKAVVNAIHNYWETINREAVFLVWMKDDNTLYLWEGGKKYGYRYIYRSGETHHVGKKFRCNARNRNRNYDTVVFTHGGIV